MCVHRIWSPHPGKLERNWIRTQDRLCWSVAGHGQISILASFLRATSPLYPFTPLFPTLVPQITSIHPFPHSWFLLWTSPSKSYAIPKYSSPASYDASHIPGQQSPIAQKVTWRAPWHRPAAWLRLKGPMEVLWSSTPAQASPSTGACPGLYLDGFFLLRAMKETPQSPWAVCASGRSPSQRSPQDKDDELRWWVSLLDREADGSARRALKEAWTFIPQESFSWVPLCPCAARGLCRWALDGLMALMMGPTRAVVLTPPPTTVCVPVQPGRGKLF